MSALDKALARQSGTSVRSTWGNDRRESGFVLKTALIGSFIFMYKVNGFAHQADDGIANTSVTIMFYLLTHRSRQYILLKLVWPRRLVI